MNNIIECSRSGRPKSDSHSLLNNNMQGTQIFHCYLYDYRIEYTVNIY